jgi:hypothetical protein
MHIEETKKKKLIEQLKKVLVRKKKILFAYLHGSFIGEEEEFLFNPDRLDSAKYNLVIAIEA